MMEEKWRKEIEDILESFFPPHQIYVRVGVGRVSISYDGLESSEATRLMGEKIVGILRERGYKTVWDGNPESVIRCCKVEYLWEKEY